MGATDTPIPGMVRQLLHQLHTNSYLCFSAVRAFFRNSLPPSGYSLYRQRESFGSTPVCRLWQGGKNATWIFYFATCTWVKCDLNLWQMRAGKQILRLGFLYIAGKPELTLRTPDFADRKIMLIFAATITFIHFQYSYHGKYQKRIRLFLLPNGFFPQSPHQAPAPPVWQ